MFINFIPHLRHILKKNYFKLCDSVFGMFSLRITDSYSIILAYFPDFEKLKEAYVISMLSVCMCISPYQLLNG
jgi:hypothetical protein